jgi:hypothetical protein
MAENGTVAIVAVIPQCDIHRYDKKQMGVPAKYDAKTKKGPWANMCDECFKEEAMYPDLGVGKGQRLVTKLNG